MTFASKLNLKNLTNKERGNIAKSSFNHTSIVGNQPPGQDYIPLRRDM